ncbi:MAG: enoyl-CoA hydratase [bacterium]|nr:enoyl-CoA hydratase [bacterium]
MYQEIRYEVEEPVATITLNRPDRLNALTSRLLAEIRHAIARAEDDADVVGIVLTGEGRGFSAGMDMDALAGDQELNRPQDDPALKAHPGDPEMGPDFQVTFGYLLSIRKPLIAAINGPAAGLGLVIACLCDLRFAAQTAVFRTSFSQRGLIAEHGSSWILPRLLGPSRALDLLWHPRKVDAQEALQLGLVNRVVEGDVAEAAREYVRELAANCSPTSLRIMKQQVYQALMQPLGDAMREANRLMEQTLKQPDFKEGVQSFVKRRPPKFGRVGK